MPPALSLSSPVAKRPAPCTPAPLAGWSARRRGAGLLLCLTLVAGCAEITGGAPRLDAAGASVRGTYPVTEKNIGTIRARALDTVNNSRSAAGLPPVVQDAALTTAADRHSRDMSAQARAWPFGTDGSAPPDRAAQAGYPGPLVGELVSETYESDVQAIATWMGHPAQRAILMDRDARAIGLGAFQDANMKLWWTMTVGK